MNTFIKMLPIELSEVTDYLEPSSEPGTDDHKVGTMSEDLKKLYTLWNHTMKSAGMMALERKFGKVDNKEEYTASLDELAARAEILKLLFWFAVKAEHDLWGRENIGVRRGFVVVWSDPEPGEDLFRRLFDGLLPRG